MTKCPVYGVQISLKAKLRRSEFSQAPGAKAWSVEFSDALLILAH